MKEKITFSVVIPAYNAGKFVANSVDSVLKQTIKDFEIIVVDDGSVDDTFQIVSAIEDERVRVFRTENGGASAARNFGVRQARGEYVCFLDSDDAWYDFHLETLSDMIREHPDKKFLATSNKTLLRNGETVDGWPKTNLTSTIYERDYFKFELTYALQFYTSCVCVARAAFDKYGYFVEGEPIGEDMDMWYRVLLYEGIVFNPRQTCLRNRANSQATRVRVDTDLVHCRVAGWVESGDAPNEVKESLIVHYERRKLSKVNSLILQNDVKNARKLMKTIDPALVKKRKYWATLLCLLLPTRLTAAVVRYRDRKFYDAK